MKTFEYLGSGRHRAVYRHGNYVIKIPLSDYGISDNYYEATIYKEYGYDKGYIPYARCRLLGTILIMEYLEPVKSFDNLPEWTMAVDCTQVGYNRHGKLLAYDYGLH
jgi:hypothetical protein